jgi:hypothetical protein
MTDSAKYELSDLEIFESSLVDSGDNPEAHVKLFKAAEDVSEESSSEESTEKSHPKNILKKVWEWVAGAPDNEVVSKMGPPRTTGEILRSQQFETDFSKLRAAFMESVDSILEYAESAEVSALLQKAVQEFSDEASSMTSEIAKREPCKADSFRKIVDQMGAVVSNNNDAAEREIRAEFAKAVAALDAFEVPKTVQKESEEMTTEKIDETESGVTAGEVNVEAQNETQVEASVQADTATVETEKNADSVAFEKRMVELEKRAANAESKLAVMVEKERTAEFIQKAKAIVPGGIDHAELGDALKSAHGHSQQEGERLEKLFSALGAQVEKGSLFKVVGSDAPVGKSGNAHVELENIAKEILKAAHMAGEKMSFAESYDKAMIAHPHLAVEAVG